MTNNSDRKKQADLRHRLNNPLTAISLKIQMAQKFISQCSSAKDPNLQKAVELLTAAQNDIREFVAQVDQIPSDDA